MEASSVYIMSTTSDHIVPPPPSNPKTTIRKSFNKSFSSNNSLVGRVGLPNEGAEKANLASRRDRFEAWK